MENYLKYIIKNIDPDLKIDVSLIMKMLLNKKKFVKKIGKEAGSSNMLREIISLNDTNKDLICKFLQDAIKDTQVIKVLLNGNEKIQYRMSVMYYFVYHLIGIFDDKYKVICFFKYKEPTNTNKNIFDLLKCKVVLASDLQKIDFFPGKNINSDKCYDMNDKIEIYTYFYGNDTEKIISIDVLAKEELAKNYDSANIYLDFIRFLKEIIIINYKRECTINKDDCDIIIIPDLNGNHITLLNIIKRLFYIEKIDKNYILVDVKIIFIGKIFGNEDDYLYNNMILFFMFYYLIMRNNGVDTQRIFMVKDEVEYNKNKFVNNTNFSLLKNFYNNLPNAIVINDKKYNIKELVLFSTSNIQVNPRHGNEVELRFDIDTNKNNPNEYVGLNVKIICQENENNTFEGRVKSFDYVDEKEEKYWKMIINNIKNIEGFKNNIMSIFKVEVIGFKKEYLNGRDYEINKYWVSSYSYTKWRIDNPGKTYLDKDYRSIKNIEEDMKLNGFTFDNKKLADFIFDNHIKYLILSSENKKELNLLQCSKSKLVDDLNLFQDIEDKSFIYRFGNKKKINGASTIIDINPTFWWGNNATYMKEILEMEKPDYKKPNRTFIEYFQKITGFNKSDLKKYKSEIIKNIFLNKYYPILLTTNHKNFDNFIVLRKDLTVSLPNECIHTGGDKREEMFEKTIKNTFMKYIGKPFFGLNNVPNGKDKIYEHPKDNGQFIVNRDIYSSYGKIEIYNDSTVDLERIKLPIIDYPNKSYDLNLSKIIRENNFILNNIQDKNIFILAIYDLNIDNLTKQLKYMISKRVLNEHLMLNENSMLIIMSNNDSYYKNNNSKKLLFNLFMMNLKNNNPSVLYLFKNGFGDSFYNKFVKKNIIINDYYYLKNDIFITPLRISNAQSASPLSLTTAHEMGVLNVQRCKNLNDKFIILNHKYENKKAFIVKKTGNDIFNLTNTRSELRENVIKNKIFTLKNIDGKRRCPTKIINTNKNKWPKSSDLNPFLVLQNIYCLVVLRLEETYEPLLNCDANKSFLSNSTFRSSYNSIKSFVKSSVKSSVKSPVKSSVKSSVESSVIKSSCPGSMIGIENRNTNKKNGGRVYCYLNSLMQMLYCIDELKNYTFLEPVFSLLNGKNGYITAETIVSIYLDRYKDIEQNILKFNDPIEFLGFTFFNITNHSKKNSLKNETIRNIITINTTRNSLDFVLSELKNDIDYKEYLFINIEKLSNNGNTTVSRFISKNATINKTLNIEHKIKYKLLGAIFWLLGPHYTFASYDDKGNVCRYYNDDEILTKIPSGITLENNGKLLLYKEYKDK